MKSGSRAGGAVLARAANWPFRRRSIRRIVAAAVAVFLLYAVGVNVALNAGAVQAALRATESVKVDFTSAWSLWPGRVHVRGVMVRMQDRNVQFVLRMATADVTIVLRDLLSRTFHATHVRGDGVSFRFRHRIAPESAHEEFVHALPELEGFSDPPLFEAGPPEAPLSEQDYDLWTIRMEDVDVQLRELWAQMVRYEGDARARGGFHLRPAKWVTVGPASLELRGGVLTSGPHTVMTKLTGDIDCTVRGFDVEPVHGMEVFRFVSAGVALRSAVPDIGEALFWLGDLAPWSLQDGAGAFTATLALRDGALAPGGEVRFASEHLRVTHLPSRYALDAQIDLALSSPAADHRASLTTKFDHVTLRRGESGALPLRVTDLSAWADVTSVDATESWSLASSGFALGELRVANLAESAELMPADGPRLLGGEATSGGQLTRDAHGAWRGSLRLDLTKAAAALSTSSVRADARLTGTLEGSARGRDHAAFRIELPSIAARSADMHVTSSGTMLADVIRDVDGAARVTGELALGKVNAYEGAGHDGAGGDCPWGLAQQGRLTGAWEQPARGDARARVSAHLNEVRVTSGDFRATANDAELSLRGDASAEGARALAGRVAARGLSLKNAGGAPRSWQADARALAVEGHLDRDGPALIGPLRVLATAIRGQVGATRLSGNVDAALQLAARGHAVRLTGDVRARNVTAATGSRSVENWWANLRVSQATLQLDRHVDLHAAVQASLQNALPALHVLSSTDDLPGWLPAALPLESFSLILDVDRYCGLTDVLVREAHGGPLSAKGRLQLEPGDTRGAVLVTLPAVVPLSVGFDFAHEVANTSPIVGDSWLNDHTRAMEQAMGRKRAEVCAPPPPQCP